MSIHIEEMSSDVSVFSGDMPLSPQQINKLVQIILQRLDDQEQDKSRHQDAIKIRTHAAPKMFLGDK